MRILHVELMELFAGYTKVHGTYQLTGEVTESGKCLGKAQTVHAPVTERLWKKHVDGTCGLGIIPINEDSNVKFGAIDVDVYPLDFVALAKAVAKQKLPLVVCRTKSQGAHLYLFLREFASAKLVQGKLREMASLLGYGTCEIFPKQTQILEERGDIGQWINMPYCGGARQAIDAKGKPLDLETFIDVANNARVTTEELEKPADTVEELEGGPPCLQLLIQQGFPSGTRNNGLFNLGVYARKLNPDGWEALIEDYNSKYMSPPLASTEVLGVIKSLRKKDYFYTCKAAPVQAFCNAAKCRGCKHGIGGGDIGLPKLGTLTKLLTQPPLWFIELEGGGRLELTSEDLQSQTKFQLRCMDVLNVMPPIVKRDRWQEIVQGLLASVQVLEVPVEATATGQFMYYLEEFCTSRVQGSSHDELLLGKPWTHDKLTYFRLCDLLKYLERQKFDELKMNKIAMILRDLGAQKHFFNVRGKGVNCYYVKEFGQQTEPLDTPKQKQEVL